jgi:hypothetical protein
MTKFESSVKIIPYNQEKVFTKLSDLNNLESIKDRIPADKITDMTFDTDKLNVTISQIGKVELMIIEREPYKTIKFETTQSPIPFNLWIQILSIDDSSCKMKLTLGAEINPFIKAMIQKPLQEGVEKMADVISLIKY